MKKTMGFLLFFVFGAMLLSAQSNPPQAGTQNFAIVEQVNSKFIYEGRNFDKIWAYGFWATLSGGPVEFDAKQETLTYFTSNDEVVMQFKTKDGRLFQLRLSEVQAISTDGNRLQFF